jgi:hypothetical protein
MNKAQMGQEIRRIAEEVERLDPSTRPVFMGMEHLGDGPGAPARGLFQGGPVMGYEASLEHVRALLAEVRQRIGQRVVTTVEGPNTELVDETRHNVQWVEDNLRWGE